MATLIAGFNIQELKYLSVFHSSPAIYENTFTISRLIDNFQFLQGAKRKLYNFAILVSYPLWRKLSLRKSGRMFARNYDLCDKCVMLSANEYPILSRYLGHEVESKCVTIHNSLTFDKIENPDCLQKKRKNVLIVSRLYNCEKRLDFALKIWKIVEDAGFNDWNLYIVGSGIHEGMLKNLAKKLKLQNVHFEGRQQSEQYYRDASIFMMTSAVEGWGLTLTESMQTGVVPIAFNSYPALTDIITDGYDGYIIPYKAVKGYADKLIQLMKDNELRERMARNGLESCRRFEIDKIVQQWVDLIESL